MSKQDYQQVVTPTLEEARREGRRVRLLYHLGPELERMTLRALFEDMRLGLRHLSLFERCAIVTDVDWIRSTSRAIAGFMPFPMRAFTNAEWQHAVEWLAAKPETSLEYQILRDVRVLVVEPRRKLRSEDFTALSRSVDSWLRESGGTLEGLVVRARRFPGWEDVGSALRHARFVRRHHRTIRRVAWAVDGTMAALGLMLAKRFVQAEIRRFDADDLQAAIAWASGEVQATPELRREPQPTEALQ